MGFHGHWVRGTRAASGLTLNPNGRGFGVQGLTGFIVQLPSQVAVLCLSIEHFYAQSLHSLNPKL